LPARVVLHKTSSFDSRELAGFTGAADEERVEHLEPIWIQRRDAPRLFRAGQLPPLRGTTLHLEEGAAVLYTRGSIEFFHTYPGLYVPRPLLVRPARASIDLIGASGEVLALSKMNWNNAQLDGRDPLTLRTASRVGAILKQSAARPGRGDSIRLLHVMTRGSRYDWPLRPPTPLVVAFRHRGTAQTSGVRARGTATGPRRARC
jgi:hypothetical protein